MPRFSLALLRGSVTTDTLAGRAHGGPREAGAANRGGGTYATVTYAT